MIKLEYIFKDNAELIAHLAAEGSAEMSATLVKGAVAIPVEPEVEEKPKRKRAPAKKKTTKQVSADKTSEAFDSPDAPAPIEAEPVAEVAEVQAEPSVDDVKSAILGWAGDGEDQMAKVKGFLKSCGVDRIGLMTGAMRAEAIAKLAKGFELEADPLA